MDFLSKLLKGDKSVQKAAKDFLNNLMADTPSQPAQKPAQQASIFSSKQQSGFSWGDVMPEEENQYNFNGSFMEYFEGIFRAELPEQVRGIHVLLRRLHSAGGGTHVGCLLREESALRM